MKKNLRANPFIRFTEAGGEGGSQKSADAPKSDAPKDGALGEGGMKALHSERDARKEAERKASDLQKRIDALEAEKLSDLEKAQKAAQDAEAERDKAARDALRWKYAAAHGISEDDAKLFLTGDTEEAVKAQAERLAARNQENALQQQSVNLQDPTQGAGNAGTLVDVKPGVDRLVHAFDVIDNAN